MARSKFESWLETTRPEVYEALMNEYRNEKGLDKIPFYEFWDRYQKKTGKKDCMAKWARMTRKEQEAALAPLEEYIKVQPNPKYRLNPKTYLNGEYWNDEQFIESKKDGREAVADRNQRLWDELLR
jgi:hypothetical protein